MKAINRVSATLLLLIVFSHILSAQETIPLNTDDISRLGIVFSSVSEIDSRTGTRFPAMVVNSPETISIITAPYAGVLSKWHVNTGHSVKTNEVLASVNSPQFLDIQNQWIAAQTQMEQADFEKSKDESLYDQGVISQQRLVRTRRDYQQAEFSLLAATEKLARAGISTKTMQDMRQAGSKLGVYYLQAAGAGILTHRAYTTGEYIETNTTVASVSTGNAWISAQLPARFALALQIGQSLSIDGYEQQLILRQKDFEIDQTSQTIEILAEFLSPTNFLPGQIVVILIPPVTEGVLIPGNAVVHSGDETTIYVRTANGAEARPLDLLPVGSDYLAQVGISIGEQVIVQGAAVLKGMQLGLGGDE